MRAMAPPEISLKDIYASITPFVLIMVCALILIMIFPSIATWLPDYVYGKNDGGSEYKLKKEAQQLFLKFWNIPPDDIRHSREGIYFDTIKEVDNLKIHFIGLDTRYFRSELKVSKSIYKDNTDKNATVLGKSQCCLLYTSPSPRDGLLSRMPSSA